MRVAGKKVGKYRVETILARYDLDVRLDMTANVFSIRVPRTPGAVAQMTGEGVNYDTFSSPTLEEVKRLVDVHLRERDTTDFQDVIEYNLDRDAFNRCDNSVGFDFRVVRVSLVRDGNNNPKLEIEVKVDADGKLSIAEHFGKPATPSSHSGRYDNSVPYTAERWRKCRALSEGITELRKLVRVIFGDGGETSAARLDASGTKLLLGESREFK